MKRSRTFILYMFVGALVLTSGNLPSSHLFAQVEKLENEAELVAILTGDAPAADKAMACKRLAVYGSAEAAPELAKLLGNEQLSSWARIALENIPGAKVDEALRTASESLQGKLLVGTLNSIGVRRDAAAVDVLKKRLQDSDVEVASAAAVALGGSVMPRLQSPCVSRSQRHLKPFDLRWPRGSFCLQSVFTPKVMQPKRSRSMTKCGRQMYQLSELLKQRAERFWRESSKAFPC